MRSNLEKENSRTGIAGSPFCLFDNQKEAGKIKKPKPMYYKKQNWVVAIVATLITMGVASCGKDVQPESVADTPSLTKSAEELNPFTYIGKEHNYALDYVGTALQPLLDSIAGLSFVTHDDYALVFDSIVERVREYYVGHSGISTSTSEVNTVLGMMGTAISYSDEDSLMIQDDVFAIFIDSFYNAVGPYANDFDVVDSMDSCVARILPSIVTHDDSVFLLSLTVYQYSLKYWTIAMNNTNSPWFEILQWADVDCFDNCVGDLPDGKDGPGKWLGNLFRNVGKAIAQACEYIAGSYTLPRIAECDRQGARLGVKWGLQSPATVVSSVLITTTVYSAFGPLFVKR